MQKWATTKTRLGITSLFHEEGLHGYAAPGATSFPIPIGLASSWDPDLVRRTNVITAREIRSEEHTSELQSLMRISYAVFCLKKKNNKKKHHKTTTTSLASNKTINIPPINHLYNQYQ